MACARGHAWEVMRSRLQPAPVFIVGHDTVQRWLCRRQELAVASAKHYISYLMLGKHGYGDGMTARMASVPPVSLKSPPTAGCDDFETHINAAFTTMDKCRS